MSEDQPADDDTTTGDGDAAEQFEREPADSEVEQIEQEREQRLSDENRPEGAEVDNTRREFDEQKGMFTDADEFNQADVRFPPAAEQAT